MIVRVGGSRGVRYEMRWAAWRCDVGRSGEVAYVGGKTRSDMSDSVKDGSGAAQVDMVYALEHRFSHCGCAARRSAKEGKLCLLMCER